MKQSVFYFTLLVIFFSLLLNSCSQYKTVSCPDFSKSRNYAENHSKSNHIRYSKINKVATYRQKEYRSGLNLMAVNRSKNSLPLINDACVNSESINFGSYTLNIPAGNRYPDLLPLASEIVPQTPVLMACNVDSINDQDVNVIFSEEDGDEITPYDVNLAQPAQVYQAPVQEPVKPASGMATASLTLGLVGLFIFGIPAGILAIVFGNIALARINNSGYKEGKGRAIAGIILGMIDILGALYVISMMAQQ